MAYEQLHLKRVLLVDDDPVVLRLYQERLVQAGMQVETAADGLTAVNSLRAAKPDVVVLDLMLPKLTGADVLKFIRAQAGLKALPVIVLSNSYMNELTAEATSLGVQKALLKTRCSPSILLGTINDTLAGESSSEDTPHLLAVPVRTPPAPPTPGPPAPAKPAAPAPPPAQVKTENPEFEAEARRTFLHYAPGTCAAMRSLCQAFTTAANEAERGLCLQNFYRRVHFTGAIAGLAGYHRVAQMASVLEALLYDLSGKPAALNPSILRTIAATVDFLALLFDHARSPDLDVPLAAQVLVVDDDPLNNRLVVSALQRAALQARSTADPAVGLQWLEEHPFDLVLLDIEMPGMNGFELCRRLRKLAGCRKTQVIYVTSHSDFESRAESVLSGGDDLISKPIFPMELAVKAIMHLLKRQVAAK